MEVVLLARIAPWAVALVAPPRGPRVVSPPRFAPHTHVPLPPPNGDRSRTGRRVRRPGIRTRHRVPHAQRRTWWRGRSGRWRSTHGFRARQLATRALDRPRRD